MKLKDLVQRKICYGIVQPGSNNTEGVPVVKAGNIVNGLNSIDELELATEESASKYPRSVLNGGELVISLVGSVGKVAVVPMSFKGANIVRATGLIDIKDEIIKYWVKYYIESPTGQIYIHTNLNTTVQPTLNIKLLEEMDIPMLDKQTMAKSVHMLRKIEDRIRINTLINKNLEEQIWAFFAQMNQRQKGEKRTLGEVTNRCNQRVGDKNYTVLSAINTGVLKPSEDYFTKQVFSKDISKYIIVDKNAFAYNPARINIGSIGINDLGFVGCVSPVYVAFSVDTQYTAFFRFYFKTKSFRENCKTRASGSVRQALNYYSFAQIELLYPPKEEAGEFNERWIKSLKTINHNLAENERLKEIKDSLIPKILTGDLDVSEIAV